MKKCKFILEHREKKRERRKRREKTKSYKNDKQTIIPFFFIGNDTFQNNNAENNIPKASVAPDNLSLSLSLSQFKPV